MCELPPALYRPSGAGRRVAPLGPGHRPPSPVIVGEELPQVRSCSQTPKEVTGSDVRRMRDHAQRGFDWRVGVLLSRRVDLNPPLALPH
jgi:hypothetical protein